MSGRAETLRPTGTYNHKAGGNMDGQNFFHQVIIILGCSITIVYLFNKIKLPSIIGNPAVVALF